ncbi:MAG: hypothetical protein PHC45_02145 [Clostridiaceae bacterium]|nr:hypothetical protein [Clostridiaceae bacterium]
MKYIIVVLLFAVLIYQLSFARYNWAKKNRLAAIGSIIIGLLAFMLPLYLIFWGKYEI